MTFSSCFICLQKAPKQLDSDEVKSKAELLNKKNKSGGINLTNFLANYLLHTHANTYDQVLNDVLNFNGGDDNVREEGDERSVGEDGPTEERSSKVCFRLCEGCGAVAQTIMTLHLAQEKIRTLIANEVKTVQETVLRSSECLGGRTSMSESKAFENFSKKFWDGDGSSKEAKELFHTLKAFQTAVYENSELVYIGNGLRQFGTCGIRARHLDPIQVQIKICPNQETESILEVVKTESEELGDKSWEESSQGDFFDVGHDDDDFGEPRERSEIRNTCNIKQSATASTGHSDNPTSSRQKRRGRSTETQEAAIMTTVTPRECYVLLKRAEVGEQNQPLSKPRKRKRTTYTCEACSYSSKNTTTFGNHLRKHETETEVKSFQCDQCDLKFSTQQAQKFHRGRVHRGNHKVKCEVCSVLVKRSEYDPHLKSHGLQIFPCPYCSRHLPSMEEHMEHLCRSHDGGDLNCKICGMVFQTKSLLVKHLDEIHNAVKRLKCDVEGCDKSFIFRHALYNHKLYNHAGPDPSICEVCAKSFETRVKLDAHRRIHYNTSKCDQCPKTFRSYTSLHTHRVRDHGVDLYRCKTCGKSCISSQQLRRHRLLVHDVESCKICPICNKKFTTSSQLKIHMETHSTTENYLCTECGKSFRTSHGLMKHRLTHGEKKHPCSHCPKAFTRLQTLRDHLRTHTGERPFECAHCGKAFNQLGARNSHMKRCPQRPSTQTQA